MWNRKCFTRQHETVNIHQLSQYILITGVLTLNGMNFRRFFWKGIKVFTCIPVGHQGLKISCVTRKNKPAIFLICISRKKIGKNNCCSIINEPKKNNNLVQSIPPCVSHTEHVFDMKYYMRYNTIRCKNILWKIIVTIMHLGQSVRETA